MKRAFTLALAAVMLTGCSARLFTYGGDLADAMVRLGPASFSIYIHPNDDTLLIQRRMSQSVIRDGAEMVSIVARTFVEPLGCTVGPTKELLAGTSEVQFTCPSNIDIRRLAQEQRAALSAGKPIHP